MESLELRAVGLGRESAEELATYLTTDKASSLTRLGLGRNRLPDPGLAAIARSLETGKASGLVSVSLQQTGLGGASNTAVQALARALQCPVPPATL